MIERDHKFYGLLNLQRIFIMNTTSINSDITTVIDLILHILTTNFFYKGAFDYQISEDFNRNLKNG